MKFPGCLSFFCLDRDIFLMFFCDFGLVSLSLLKRSLFPLGYASIFGWVVVDPIFLIPGNLLYQMQKNRIIFGFGICLRFFCATITNRNV